MPVEVSLSKIQTSKQTTAKCGHCGKYFVMTQLQRHIQEVQKNKKAEEERKKAEKILKEKKDLRAVIEKREQEKDLRTKLIKLQQKKEEEAKAKKKMNSAVRNHYIKALRSDTK